MDFKVADLSLAGFGRKEINLAEHEMPGLISVRKKFGPGKPLKGVRITGSVTATRIWKTWAATWKTPPGSDPGPQSGAKARSSAAKAKSQSAAVNTSGGRILTILPCTPSLPARMPSSRIRPNSRSHSSFAGVKV